MTQVSKASTILAPARFVYDWHTRDGAFQRLIPPWESLEYLYSDGDFENLVTHLKVKKYGLKFNWVAKHIDVESGVQFKDYQVKGPFKSWVHHHEFKKLSDNRIKMIDNIEYKMPFHLLSSFAQGYKVKQDIEAMLSYRHKLLSYEMSLLQGLPLKPQVIAISGASGLIGQKLVHFLRAAGHTVRCMVRKEKPNWQSDLRWDPKKGILDDFSDVNMLIHLAGEPINAPIQWSNEKKERIYSSRVESSKVLVKQLKSQKHQIHTIVCASGISCYPSSDKKMTETSPSGNSFLASVVKDWESAFDPIREEVRVCHARLGIVMHPHGGIIKKLRPLMNLGVLGPIGSGKQYMSWVSLDDTIRAFYTMLASSKIVGPVNVVSPEPMRQMDWIKTWGSLAFRPSILPLPSKAVKKVMGEMGEELLLQSSNVSPEVLKKNSFKFQCHSFKELFTFYKL